MYQLPLFPKFKKLSLGHKDTLQAIANHFPSSDFNFAGLFTWDVGGEVMVCSLNGNLVMRSSDYLTHVKFYSFIGDNLVDETIKTLTDYAKARGEDSKLRLIPESVAKKIQPSDKQKIEEDRDNFDYIHLVSDFVDYQGPAFMKKRNMVSHFNREHGSASKALELDLNDQKTRNDIADLLSRWATSRGKQDSEVTDELVATNKALEHHELLGMRAFGAYHNESLIGFTIFEILPNKVAMGHFEKADANFKGVFEYLNQSFAKHLVSLGVETLNTEQDLGVEGIRKSKESYNPVEFIKKYTVERID